MYILKPDELPSSCVQIYSPTFAPHVKGGWEARESDAIGFPAPQKIYCVCTKCNTRYQTTCTTGQVKTWVHRFAIVHLHRDPFEQPVLMPKTKPGM